MIVRQEGGANGDYFNSQANETNSSLGLGNLKQQNVLSKLNKGAKPKLLVIAQMASEGLMSFEIDEDYEESKLVTSLQWQKLAPSYNPFEPESLTIEVHGTVGDSPMLLLVDRDEYFTCVYNILLQRVEHKTDYFNIVSHTSVDASSLLLLTKLYTSNSEKGPSHQLVYWRLEQNSVQKQEI